MTSLSSRDGKTIETLHKGVDDFSEDRIIRGMVGREISDRFPKRSGVTIGDVCMEVRDWTVFHPVYRDQESGGQRVHVRPQGRSGGHLPD